MAEAKRRATYEDLVKVPDTKIAEIIDGELIVSPMPGILFAATTTVFGAEIGRRFDRDPREPGPGGWWILFRPEVHFGDDVLVPDCAGWRLSRLPVLGNLPFMTLPPDWACEVVSPSTARIDRSRKMRIYGDAGVPSLWLVDPLARTLEVYRRDADRWVVAAVHGGNDVVRAEPFDAVELGIARWWLPDATG